MAIIDQELKTALHDIVLGKTIRRGRHRLEWDGEDLSRLFVRVLNKSGYIGTTVQAVKIKPGERVPAFLIRDGVAYFGWVFYEKFSDEKIRKLWGSVIKNSKGDWAIQLTPRKKEEIYANDNKGENMDLNYPSEF